MARANPWRMAAEPRRWWHVDAPQDFVEEGDLAWTCYLDPDTERRWWFRASDGEVFFEDEALASASRETAREDEKVPQAEDKLRHAEGDTGSCVDTKEYEGDTGSCMDTKDCDASIGDVRAKDQEPWGVWSAWREVETRKDDEMQQSEVSRQTWWRDAQNQASCAFTRHCQTPLPFRAWLVDMLRLVCRELVHRCLVTRAATNDLDSAAPELLMKMVCNSLLHKNLVSLVLGLESNAGGQLHGLWSQLCIGMAGGAKRNMPGRGKPLVPIDPRHMEADILVQFICLVLHFAPEAFSRLRDKQQPCLQLVVDLGRSRATTNINSHESFIAELDVGARDMFLHMPPVVQRRIVGAARRLDPDNLNSFVMSRGKNLSREWELILSEARSPDRSHACGSSDRNCDSDLHTSAQHLDSRETRRGESCDEDVVSRALLQKWMARSGAEHGSTQVDGSEFLHAKSRRLQALLAATAPVTELPSLVKTVQGLGRELFDFWGHLADESWLSGRDPRYASSELVVRFLCASAARWPRRIASLRPRSSVFMQLLVEVAGELSAGNRKEGLSIPHATPAKAGTQWQAYTDHKSVTWWSTDEQSPDGWCWESEWRRKFPLKPDASWPGHRQDDKGDQVGDTDDGPGGDPSQQLAHPTRDASLEEQAKSKAESWLHACADNRNLGASSSRPSSVSSKPRVPLPDCAPEDWQWREPPNQAHQDYPNESSGGSWHWSDSNAGVNGKSLSPKDSSRSDELCAEPWIQRECSAIAAVTWSTCQCDRIDSYESRGWSDGWCWERPTGRHSFDTESLAGYETGNWHGAHEVDKSSTADSQVPKQCHTASPSHSNVPSQHSQIAEVVEATRDLAAALQCIERAVLRMDRALKGPGIR